jgi:N-acetylmuramoyl-L-alanine amidase
MTNKPNKIIIHCSDSTFGNAITIDKWHRERGFDSVGYHFVILNGKPKKGEWYHSLDGQIECGRNVDTVGAHARGVNRGSIGICLIGVTEFTERQYEALSGLLIELCDKYDIMPNDIYGHYDVSNKTCPNFNVQEFVHNFFEMEE